MGVRSQTGSALTEFAVLMVVSVPLFLMLPMLGKMADVNQSTIQASRYGAWERTVSNKEGKRLLIEISNRFFANPDLGIRSGRGGVVSGQGSQNVFWSGYGADSRFFTAGEDVIDPSVVGEGKAFEQSAAGRLSTNIVKMGEEIGKHTGGNWDLSANGMFVSTVRANVSGNSLLQKGKNCQGNETDKSFVCVERTNVILVDGWGARDALHVEERTKSLVPLGALQPFGDALAKVGRGLSILGDAPFGELKKLEGAFGLVKPDVLLEDYHYGD